MAKSIDWLAEKISGVMGFFTSSEAESTAKRWVRYLLGIFLILTIIFSALGWYWSRTPDIFWVTSEIDNKPVVKGFSIFIKRCYTTQHFPR